ncbi:MFS transporter [Croceitalea sp. P059]|uniref:MFS transporter n=1 Tax=Croceitalea sp. P059 TaxID=3075601 RepID=UPI00288403E6|nr:MFS transporter [Croceitalea sp. P059]MDT0540656.1 MFS transporter [Croceitalea sp. P059]
MKSKKKILVIIVLAQFCCTTLWFASNGVLEELITNFNLNTNTLGNLTSAVQFGFISGTLVFALLTITDRFSPSKVFLMSAILGAIFNGSMLWPGNTLLTLIAFRFLTGFFLAGIYPVGMKIAADYFDKGLGKSLGFLVGALVLGTAFPHLLKGITTYFSWQSVIITTSVLAILGGILLAILVPNGPFRKKSQQPDLGAFFKVFQNPNFRAAALGYFGHMWELYVFWAFVPIMLGTYQSLNQSSLNIPLLSFGIIAIGGIACVLSGHISQKIGVKKTASTALFLSGCCCLAAPLFFTLTTTSLFVGFLFFWGMVVIADSPLFSTLVAQNATPELKGTALTIVNCIGFTITIISIQLMVYLQLNYASNWIYTSLAVGPIFGLIALTSSKKTNR